MLRRAAASCWCSSNGRGRSSIRPSAKQPRPSWLKIGPANGCRAAPSPRSSWRQGNRWPGNRWLGNQWPGPRPQLPSRPQPPCPCPCLQQQSLPNPNLCSPQPSRRRSPRWIRKTGRLNWPNSSWSCSGSAGIGTRRRCTCSGFSATPTATASPTTPICRPTWRHCRDSARAPRPAALRHP